MSEKKGLLPIVKEETGISIQGKILAQEQYLEDLIRHIGEENLCVSKCILAVSEITDDPQSATALGMLIYNLLEEQGNGKLPKVSEDTLNLIQKELLERENKNYLVNLLTRLKEDNPCVANFIGLMAMQSGDPMTVSFSGAVVYRLLECQAEADKLKYQFEV